MTDAAVLPKLVKAAKTYSRDVADLLPAGSTTEATFYPAIRSLLSAALEHTSERGPLAMIKCHLD
jgi:hypothetical protein